MTRNDCSYSARPHRLGDSLSWCLSQQVLKVNCFLCGYFLLYSSLVFLNLIIKKDINFICSEDLVNVFFFNCLIY